MEYSSMGTNSNDAMELEFGRSKDRLVALRKEYAGKPQEMVDNEREFLFRECAKLDNLAKLHQNLDEYREVHSTSSRTVKMEEAKKSGNSGVLGNHLRAEGFFPFNNRWEAHHIVCSTHKSHLAARLKLFAYRGINDPINGCWLPMKQVDAEGSIFPDAVGHKYIHTQKYALWVRDEVLLANNPQALNNRLRSIRQKLLRAKNDTEIAPLLTDKGKNDLFGQ